MSDFNNLKITMEANSDDIINGLLKAQIKLDLQVYGVAYVRRHSDGRKERIPPTEMVKITEQEKLYPIPQPPPPPDYNL